MTDAINLTNSNQRSNFMNGSLAMPKLHIGILRQASLFMRSVTSIVLITFSTVTLSPGARAIAQTIEDEVAYQTPLSTGNPHTDKIERIKERLQRIHNERANRSNIANEKAELRALRKGLAEQNNSELEQFSAIEKHLKERNLPDVILQRHRDAVAKFMDDSTKLDTDLADIDGTNDELIDAKVLSFRDRLDHLQIKRRHQSYNPKNLPFGTPRSKIRTPKAKPEEFAELFNLEPVQGLQLVSSNATVLAMVAQSAISVPGPEYLAQTEEIQITPEIVQLANSLHHNPVEIYNWVYNNIEFLPTYGSVQGSDLTLQTKRGNAFDTSSLLIALLRAAGIPARYVYGTVDIAADKVMNWVGGTTAPLAAINLLSQGGIPVTGLAQGGSIKSVRMEHVWAEAFVDFVPSRGAKNVAPDSWVPMDAAYKQFAYSNGLNINASVQANFNPQELLKQGAEIDPVTGAVTNLNVPAVQVAFEDYQASVEQFVKGLGDDVTIDKVIGGKKIKSINTPVLAGSLPYRIAIRATSFAAVPSAMRHYIRLSLFNSQSEADQDSPILTKDFALSTLGGKRLGVTYRAATAADAATIDSFAQTGATRLPAYLIKQIPVVQIDGSDSIVGSPIGMGEDQFWQVTLIQPDDPTAHVHTYTQIAGDEIVFGIDGNGITQDVIRNRIAKFPSLSAAENLHLIALHYWAESDLANKATGQGLGVLAQRLVSVGVFASPASVIYSFGVPRQVFYKSRSVDISRSFVGTAGKAGQGTASFLTIAGVQGSILEGRILEQTTGAAYGSGSSAIQLLVDAANQSIPLHTISAANAERVLPKLAIDPEVIRDISSAIDSGKIVLVSERPPSRIDWSGVGYVIADPETGAGAYLIKGGLNGGELGECQEQRQPLVNSIVEMIMTALLIAAIIAAGIIISGGSGGSLAPAAIAIAAVGLGLVALTFPRNASANSCDQGCHRGRLQAQGGRLQKSVTWNQPTPLTLSQGLNLLNQLAAQLTPSELAERADGFAGAERFMRNAAASGGVCAIDIPNSLSFPKIGTIRIDIEVWEGRAFTPN